MKPSHYTTPRTMEDATFQPWGQAIHHDGRHRYSRADRAVLWASAIGFVFVALIVAFVPEVKA